MCFLHRLSPKSKKKKTTSTFPNSFSSQCSRYQLTGTRGIHSNPIQSSQSSNKMEMGSGSFLQVSNGNESLKFGSGSSSCSSSKSSSNGSSSSTRVVNSNSKQVARCQVEGCSVDLSGGKAYYGRHKVCPMHSKSPMVIVAGQHQRFCQQCSRFHQLSEFDQGKRSCRRRLAGHNERRRKPPPAAMSSRIGLSSSSFLADNSSRLRSFLVNFAYPQLSGKNAWATNGAGDQMTSKQWQGGTWLSVPEGSCSDSGCARSLLSAQPRGNMLGGNQAPLTTTATATTSMTTSVLSNDCFDQASIVPCKDGFGSWGFPSKLKLACERKRQCLDNEGNRSL